MKHFWTLAIMLSLWSCHRTMEAWPSEGERQEVAMYVRTRSLSGITPTPTAYQFFIFNKETSTFTQYHVNPENHTQMHLKLFPGDYIGYCVTGGEEENAWIFEENLPAEQIFLKAQKNNQSHEEAKDHLLGSQEFSVTDHQGAPVIFDLKRKVSMLKVRIENIPEWVTDLQINLSNVAKQMSLTGEYAGSYTVTKDISIPEDGISETTLLVFPPLENETATLTLSSNELVFISPEHPIDSILANRITAINAIFQNAPTSYQVNITSQLVDWEDPMIQEEDWHLDLPQEICMGNGNGIELVVNGSFEEAFVNNIPPNWTLDASSNEYPRTALSVTTPVQSGGKAVLTEGKTYIYQDVPVVGGQCYQLHLFVNAPQTNAKWKCYSTWYKGSTKLTSDQLQSTQYEGQTDGYIDFYNGKVFRAPTNANKLRIEIRNYNDPISGEGIYIDAVSVQAVD